MKADGSYIFDQKTPAYQSEIKYRSMAERIVMANGATPSPNQSVSSRLMSLLDRDDISHLIYTTAEIMNGIKYKISAMCHVEQRHEKGQAALQSKAKSDQVAAVEQSLWDEAHCRPLRLNVFTSEDPARKCSACKKFNTKWL